MEFVFATRIIASWKIVKTMMAFAGADSVQDKQRNSNDTLSASR